MEQKPDWSGPWKELPQRVRPRRLVLRLLCGLAFTLPFLYIAITEDGVLWGKTLLCALAFVGGYGGARLLIPG